MSENEAVKLENVKVENNTASSDKNANMLKGAKPKDLKKIEKILNNPKAVVLNVENSFVMPFVKSLEVADMVISSSFGKISSSDIKNVQTASNELSALTEQFNKATAELNKLIGMSYMYRVGNREETKFVVYESLKNDFELSQKQASIIEQEAFIKKISPFMIVAEMKEEAKRAGASSIKEFLYLKSKAPSNYSKAKAKIISMLKAKKSAKDIEKELSLFTPTMKNWVALAQKEIDSKPKEVAATKPVAKKPVAKKTPAKKVDTKKAEKSEVKAEVK